jgi:hypothetical protein
MVAAMTKLIIVVITFSAALAAYTLFAFQLPPKNVQQIVFAEEQSIPTKSEATGKLEILNVNNDLSQEISTTATQPFLSNESITAALLLLCTGLVGLVGISRKNRN